ncbi:DUF1642 domain-containing protein [uncultured Streptococcus sp.]|uniref:DUF1642 domain-containing protein n=1 Tax=uncultured Streptococcus sp. TaxID=83427 RepID=UPI0026763CB5|nr:DUF1642 domain-containing protein [uncultured Streptococcus sp.]
MMDKDEAVLKLIKVARVSEAYANDLYDSFFEKPVVPQYVADWYEANKRNLDLSLSGLVFDLATNSPIYYNEEFKAWVEDNKETFITTIVNMHQFGYEVEKEHRYTVKIKGLKASQSYLNCNASHSNWFLSDDEEFEAIHTHHTRKELEDADFGWVFSCEGVEVKEVTDEND